MCIVETLGCRLSCAIARPYETVRCSCCCEQILFWRPYQSAVLCDLRPGGCNIHSANFDVVKLFIHDTNLLTPYSRVLLEKLTGSVSQSRNSPHFMEPEGSVAHSQVPATCPCPEPTRSSPYPHIPLSEDPS